MTTPASTMTYDDHVKAIAAAYDADAQAALAQHEANKRRAETDHALRAAQRALRHFTDQNIQEHVVTDPVALRDAWIPDTKPPSSPLSA